MIETCRARRSWHSGLVLNFRVAASERGVPESASRAGKKLSRYAALPPGASLQTVIRGVSPALGNLAEGRGGTIREVGGGGAAVSAIISGEVALGGLQAIKICRERRSWRSGLVLNIGIAACARGAEISLAS